MGRWPALHAVGGPSCSASFRCSDARREEVAASRPRHRTATIRSSSRRRRCPTSLVRKNAPRRSKVRPPAATLPVTLVTTGDWTCDPGYRCDPFDAPDGDATVGICLPENGGGVGDPCEVGPMAQNADPLRDRVIRAHVAACSDGAACNTNAVGFPGGMCTPSCGALSSQGACGRFAILDAFNACLAERQSFETCIAEHSSPAGLRRCSPDEPCRDDYICAGSGICIPPYFVFQMRVDGHPAPPAR
jgi:hypothetical protein